MIWWLAGGFAVTVLLFWCGYRAGFGDGEESGHAQGQDFAHAQYREVHGLYARGSSHREVVRSAAQIMRGEEEAKRKRFEHAKRRAEA